MKPLPLVLILIIVTFINDCNTEIQGLKSISTTTPTPEPEICKTKKCIKKCCPENSFVLHRKRKCAKFNGTSLNITLPVYDSDIELTSKSFEDQFHLIPRAFENVKFRISVFEATMFGFNAYLTESGTVFLELPNAYQRWTPQTTDRYCVDYQFVPQLDNTTTPAIGVWAVFDQDDAMVEGNRFFTVGMTISCVFLVLVLVVYSLLPELRNLGGMVLMAYDVSLLFAFIFLMIVQRGEHPTEGCIGLTLMVYFFFLASFCWMNIMSFDIWWTFRGYAKARPIHRRGEKCKFATYCLYAWGLPSAMTVALGVLNHVDLKHLPWLITPKIPDKGCFLEGGEKLVYLYAPMLLMIILNWLFFLMTAFNIWRLSRGTAVLDSAAAGNPASHRKQRHRLLVYLKLSILMGLNWILEVASSFKHDLKIWYVTDGYNLLIGLAIFLIFVCKKKILRKLKKVVCPSRAPTNTSFVKSRSNSSVTETSNISQDTPTYIINNDPKGPFLVKPSFKELNIHIQSLKI